MQQFCTYGSVRGALGNRRPYRDKTRSGEEAGLPDCFLRLNEKSKADPRTGGFCLGWCFEAHKLVLQPRCAFPGAFGHTTPHAFAPATDVDRLRMRIRL
jgi:hypothetical protein